MKKTGEYSHISHNPGIPGQSSPRPVVIPRMNTGQHHNSTGFIGPQLPHMTKVPKTHCGMLWRCSPVVFGSSSELSLFLPGQSALHVNGNGSVRDYPTNSKPSTSSSAIGRPSHSMAASSSSASHLISRPTMIPDHDKRQKLSFFIGHGKQSRPSSFPSPYSQMSSASSSSSASSPSSTTTSSSTSISSSQSTSDGSRSDVRLASRQLNHTNGQSSSNGDCHSGGNGASFLVPYSQESSEESDQENGGALDNGSAPKMHLNGRVKAKDTSEKSPQATNGGSGVHHNGNGLNGQTYGITKPTQNGHYGHSKVNGHDTSDKVIPMFLDFCVICPHFSISYLFMHLVPPVRRQSAAMAVQHLQPLVLPMDYGKTKFK